MVTLGEPDGNESEALVIAPFPGALKLGSHGVAVEAVRRGRSAHVVMAQHGPSSRLRLPVSATFFPDGKRVATIGPDGTAEIWAVSTGRALHVVDGAA